MLLEFLKEEKIFRLTDDAGERTRSRSLRFAARYREHADEPTEKYLSRRLIAVSPFTGSIERGEGLGALTPEQMKAIKFALSRNRSYLALDPGMGKTRAALEVFMRSGAKTLEVICPPHALDVWVKEFREWFDHFRVTKGPQNIRIDFDDGRKVRIVPDSMIGPKYTKGISRPEMLIVDEAHRFKAGGDAACAKRTLYLLGKDGLVNHVKRVVLLSGTPMPNRPAELYPVLKKLAPEVIDDMGFHEFGLRYCGAYQDSRGHWHYKGGENLGELFDRMREVFMLRLRKDQARMGSKAIEEIRIIGDDLRGEVGDLDRSFLAKHSPDEPEDIPRDKMSRYFRLLGEEKIRPAVRVIAWDDVLLGPDDGKAIIFAHHKDVVKDLARRLARWTGSTVPVIDGDTSKRGKTDAIHRFRFDKRCRMIVLNIAAGGTSTTLIEGNRVYMVEFDWSPETNRQARDRAHRLGQKRDVRVQYLVFKNSLDRVKLEENLRKQKMIDAL